MNPVWLSLPIIAALAALCWMVVWSRADTWARPAAVVLFLAAIPIVGVAMAETLSRAKPLVIAWELDAGQEYQVLAARMIQDVGIWIWLDTGESEPRSYVLSWDNDTAEAIQRGLDGAPEGSEGQLKMQYTHDGVTGVAEFHAIPQPPSPPAKDTPEPGLTYVPPADD